VLIDDESVAHSRPFYSENSTIPFKSFIQIAGKIRRGQLNWKNNPADEQTNGQELQRKISNDARTHVFFPLD
jgi:hypothetical protein